jgi:hypothetical protein
MTNKTKLLIKRVVIHEQSKTVYDEKFHQGLNVIRGFNGTGKSTIMELISYGLGGDIKKHSWKKEAINCSRTIISLNLNNQPYVFKRAIENITSRPLIEIYEGEYEESLHNLKGWSSYKNNKTESRKSYSMQIFELLGLQQHNTADSESLTMHQLFRLLYIDQDTPVSKIFRSEPFIYDKESMRKAIGEYIFGFDDLEAHSLRQKLYSANKAFDKLDDELRTIYKILGQTNIKATSMEIDEDVKNLTIELNLLAEKRQEVIENKDSFEDEKINNESKQLQLSIKKQVNLIEELDNEFVSIAYDLSESEEFILSLEYRKTALEQANLTSSCFEVIEFKYCPSCLTKVQPIIEENKCCLCHSESNDKKINDTYIQALNELGFQLSETKQMLKKQFQQKAHLQSSIKNHKETLHHLRSNLREVSNYSSDYEVQLTELAKNKGYIEAQMSNLKGRLELAAKLDVKRDQKNALQTKLTEYQDKLDTTEFARESRIKTVKKTISNKVLSILKADGGVEPAFDTAHVFDFDFSSDSLRLDGRANFSASSNVILKNAFHLATLLVAVEDTEFRLPCFMMLDNIEDKGMKESRSQNFQRIIVDVISKLKCSYQIIMTTSMVEQTLNNDTYGVGPYYEKGFHTLDV